MIDVIIFGVCKPGAKVLNCMEKFAVVVFLNQEPC
jgi:hypothetical protein